MWIGLKIIGSRVCQDPRIGPCRDVAVEAGFSSDAKGVFIPHSELLLNQ
jgi:hypothetical protein